MFATVAIRKVLCGADKRSMMRLGSFDSGSAVSFWGLDGDGFGWI